jgi:hypothetical protein
MISVWDTYQKKMNHKDRKDRKEKFLCGLRGLCGSAVSALLNSYDFSRNPF